GQDYIRELFKRKRDEHTRVTIERAMTSEEEQDKRIREAIKAGKYIQVKPADTPYLFTVVSSFLSTVSPVLLRDFLTMVETGRFMMITEEEEGKRLEKAHAGNKGIYMPYSKDGIDTGTLIKLLFEKSGFTGRECEVFEEVYMKYLAYFLNGDPGEEGVLPRGMSVTEEEEILLGRARISGFVSLNEHFLNREFAVKETVGRDVGGKGTACLKDKGLEGFTDSIGTGIMMAGADWRINSLNKAAREFLQSAEVDISEGMEIEKCLGISGEDMERLAKGEVLESSTYEGRLKYRVVPVMGWGADDLISINTADIKEDFKRRIDNGEAVFNEFVANGLLCHLDPRETQLTENLHILESTLRIEFPEETEKILSILRDRILASGRRHYMIYLNMAHKTEEVSFQIRKSYLRNLVKSGKYPVDKKQAMLIYDGIPERGLYSIYSDLYEEGDKTPGSYLWSMKEYGYYSWQVKDIDEALYLAELFAEEGLSFEFIVCDAAVLASMSERDISEKDSLARFEKAGFSFPVFFAMPDSDTLYGKNREKADMLVYSQSESGKTAASNVVYLSSYNEIESIRKHVSQLQAENSIKLNVASIGKRALVYGSKPEEGIQRLTAAGFKGDIVLARDEDELMTELTTGGHFDIIINTTGKSLREILKRLFGTLEKCPLVIETIQTTNTLQNILLKRFA
ncbi:MAG: hypothetical protein ABH883_05830, partial [Candidatus Omnitrophota bacterium]